MLVLMLGLLVVGLVIGLFVTQQPVALGLSVAIGIGSAATVFAFSEYPWQLDRESVGVIALLVATMIGCWLGATVRTRRLAVGSHIA